MKVKRHGVLTYPSHADAKEVKNTPRRWFDRRDLETRTSLDPLYETTDRYRQVIKPIPIEEFLS